MKKDDTSKKEYRKKIESQLHKLVEEHLSTINKDAASKLSKTIQESVKQIAKKFYKSHFSVETEKNEKVISDIVKAKSFKKAISKKVPESLSSIKFDKIFEKKNEEGKLKTIAKKQTPVKKAIPSKKAVVVKKAAPIKKTIIKKATSIKQKPKVAVAKASSVLSSIPKEFKLTISKKTSKK